MTPILRVFRARLKAKPRGTAKVDSEGHNQSLLPIQAGLVSKFKQSCPIKGVPCLVIILQKERIQCMDFYDYGYKFLLAQHIQQDT